MKKLLLAVAAFVGMAISANAQLGISAGLTSASATLEAAAQDVTGGSINQYHVGLTYKIGIGNILAIQPSILYNVKGSSFRHYCSVNYFFILTFRAKKCM